MITTDKYDLKGFLSNSVMQGVVELSSFSRCIEEAAMAEELVILLAQVRVPDAQ